MPTAPHAPLVLAQSYALRPATPGRRWPRLFAAMALAAAASVVVPGCAQPGRVGVTRTTAAEKSREQIYPAALIEFSDQASRHLVADLGEVKAIDAIPGKATVILGDIDNKTGNVSSDEFDLMRQRLRGNLLNSDIAREKLTFVENRARVRRLAQRERVASGGRVADAPDYDPATTFTLNGDFFRIHRGNTNLYYLQVQLVNFATHGIVWQNHYDVKQVN